MSKDIFAALARAKADRAHAIACRQAIKERADQWLIGTNETLTRFHQDDDSVLDPRYNAKGVLRVARDHGILMKLRDGA
jgi:hypothetical protein